VDPINDTDFWTLQTYAATKNSQSVSNRQGRFGVWWGKVVATVHANDAFTNATTLSGSIGTNNLTLYRTTRETGEPVHASVTTVGSVWFKWTPTSSGLVTFDTLKSVADTDTVLAAYTGSSVGSLTVVASNDDAKVASGLTTIKVKRSSISFNATAGTTYRIAVASKSEMADQVTLFWIQPQSPLFIEEPENKYLLAGDPLILESMAIGTPAPSYQWKLNAVNVGGATYASYTNSNPQPASTNGPTTYEYMAVASNLYGSATSRISYVTIYTTATATHDGIELLSGDRLKFTVNGISNYLYTVQVTSDFITWTNLITDRASFFFTNQIPTNSPYLFFRSIY
jgi:hypothetical protein